jgi:glycosyltransferase involved in cell wall biosynthesis
VRVSVGIPVFNSARFVAVAIESILAQTLTDFELIIADNASTDDSVAVCERYAAQDSRIRLFRGTENCGAAGNFNRVFELSRAAYFMWMSSNDYLAPRFLEKAVPVLDARPDVCICSARTRYFHTDVTRFEEVEDDMDITGNSPVERFLTLCERLRINNVMHGLIRRDTLLRTPLLQPYTSSDNLMVAELALLGKFAQLPEPLFYRRMEAEAATIMMTKDELTRFYAPRRSTDLRFQAWRRLQGFWSILHRTPLGPQERLRLLGFLFRRVYWDHRSLLRDFREVVFGR